MNQTKEYIDALLARFVEGQTTEDEERTLKEFFSHAEEIPAEWEPYKVLFDSFDTDAYDVTDEELDTLLTPTLTAKGPKTPVKRWVPAACVAAVMALAFLLPWHRTAAPEPAVAQAITTAELMETIAMLSEAGPDDMTITAKPSSKGFVVNTRYVNGHSDAYMLKRGIDGSSLQLTSLTINK